MYHFVLETVYKRVPGLAVGLEDAGVVLGLPPAAALDVGAVAVGGVRAEPSAVLAEGEALLASVSRAAAAVALVRARPFEADEGAGHEVALRHCTYMSTGRKL